MLVTPAMSAADVGRFFGDGQRRLDVGKSCDLPILPTCLQTEELRGIQTLHDAQEARAGGTGTFCDKDKGNICDKVNTEGAFAARTLRQHLRLDAANARAQSKGKGQGKDKHQGKAGQGKGKHVGILDILGDEVRHAMQIQVSVKL